MEAAARKKNIDGLTGIRALCCIGIFLFHSGFLLQGTFPVTLFFMLSGFMLYYTKHDLAQYPTYGLWLKNYVFRKFRQFYPLHLLTLILALFVGKTLPLNWETAKLLTLQLTLTQSFFEKYALTLNALSWYLSVTMFLYVIGWFLLKFAQQLHHTKAWIGLVLLLIFTVNIINMSEKMNIYIYSSPIYRTFDFLLGILAAKLFAENEDSRFKKPSAIEILLVVWFVFQYVFSLLFPVGNPGYYSLLFVIALLVFAKGEGCISHLLCARGFKVIARYSFEFYMFHELILRIFRKVFADVMVFYPIKLLLIALPSLVISAGLAVGYKHAAAKVSRQLKGLS